jgi:hypothetical protein
LKSKSVNGMIGKLKVIMEKKFDGDEVWDIAMAFYKDFGGVRFVEAPTTRKEEIRQTKST